MICATMMAIGAMTSAATLIGFFLTGDANSSTISAQLEGNGERTWGC